MQVYTPKSSCAPPSGMPWVMLSTEGAKVADWRYNQSITDLREGGNPQQKTTHFPPKWSLTVGPIIYVIKPVDCENHKKISGCMC